MASRPWVTLKDRTSQSNIDGPRVMWLGFLNWRGISLTATWISSLREDRLVCRPLRVQRRLFQSSVQGWVTLSNLDWSQTLPDPVEILPDLSRAPHNLRQSGRRY